MNIGKSIGLELGQSTRFAFGEELAALGDVFPTLVVVDGDVGNSTRTEVFGKKYPERFFSAGIAESNMVSMAAGLALSGHISVASSFAAFLTCNAYDQIRMGVGFPHANVKLVGSHCGISIGEAELVAALARGESEFDSLQQGEDRDERNTDSGNLSLIHI